MQAPTSIGNMPGHIDTLGEREAHSSGVSWAAVSAGAFVTAALSLTLLALGSGFGLLTVSPWSGTRTSASAVDAAAIVWLIVVQLLAASAGGYLAGRLRTKWTAIHTDEVYFRDTAHGFLVWAVAVVVTAAFLGSAATAFVGGVGTKAEISGQENGYFVDELFRSNPSASGPLAASGTGGNSDNGLIRSEAAAILPNALGEEATSASDRAYLAQLVVARTGLTQGDAAQRVSSVVAQARQAADAARKAISRLLLWTFVSLLIGAFCASYAATVGGRQRDHMKPI